MTTHEFKFIHTADIHLDSPLRGLSRYDGAPVDLLRNATRQAFENLIETAVKEKVNFMVIAGDLYDGTWRDFNTGLFFVHQMGKLREAGIQVYVLFGNHDAESRMTKQLRLPDNVHTFDTKKPETIEYDEVGVALHGQSFKTPDTTDNLAAAYPAPISGLLNIGVLHTALEGDADHAHYAPCSLSELVNKGYDYWALGHVHKQSIRNKEPYVVYSGNLQGRKINEIGPKGAIMVSVDDGHITQVTPVFTDVARWALIEIDASNAENTEDIIKQFESALEIKIAEEADGRLLAVRLIIRGRCPVHSKILAGEDQFTEDIRAAALGLGTNQAWVEKIKVETESNLDPQALREREDALGDLQDMFCHAGEDDELISKLKEEIEPLIAKLPAEVRDSADDGLLKAAKDNRMEKIIAEASELAISKLLGAGN